MTVTPFFAWTRSRLFFAAFDFDYFCGPSLRAVVTFWIRRWAKEATFCAAIL
jgi:hypothetical protein